MPLLLSGLSPSAGTFGASRRPLLSLLCHLPSPCQLRGIRGADARIRAVDDVTFWVCRAATTALVGESRSGKSTVATMILFTYSTGGLVGVRGVRGCGFLCWLVGGHGVGVGVDEGG